MRCPTCHQTLDPTTLRCEQGHQFRRENGIPDLRGDDLRRMMEAVQQYRDSALGHLPAITDYNGLPCNLDHFEWRFRCQDIPIVRRLLRGKQLRILEIGGWNGWLTHHLVRWGHSVTAVDYTAHPDDGLGAMRHYDVTWEAVQMDVTDLTPLDRRFDLAIINHGLHLFPAPVDYVAHVQQFAESVLLLGLVFYRDPSRRVAQVDALKRNFEAQYGLPFYFKPTRAYLDFDDKQRLAGLGLRLRPYLRRANLKATLLTYYPFYIWASDLLDKANKYF